VYAMGRNHLEQFRNWCRPKPPAFTWFSLKENHSSLLLPDHSNCENALKAGVEKKFAIPLRSLAPAKNGRICDLGVNGAQILNR
jgi:hypothetical protein